MGRLAPFWIAALLLASPLTPLGAQEGAERPPYRIGVEDVLEVNVWHNPDLSRQVLVRSDGRITLPLIGEVMVEGLTIEELAAQVADRLREYVTEPLVTVNVTAVNSYSVYLLGRVGAQGQIRLQGPRTFLQVLAMAGGFQEFAETDNLVLVRREGGEEKRIPVNAKKIIAKGTEADFVLRPGDVVIVP